MTTPPDLELKLSAYVAALWDAYERAPLGWDVHRSQLARMARAASGELGEMADRIAKKDSE